MTPKKPHGILTTYMLEGVPRALIDSAKAKAKTEMPPTSLKAVLIRLLKTYTGADRESF